jgi:hypothetical protein
MGESLASVPNHGIFIRLLGRQRQHEGDRHDTLVRLMAHDIPPVTPKQKKLSKPLVCLANIN